MNKELRDYEREVEYIVYRSGYNSDSINLDRVYDDFYNGRSSEFAARNAIENQQEERNRMEQRRYEQEQQEYYEYQRMQQIQQQTQQQDEDWLPF